MIQRNFIDMDNMFTLLETKNQIKDKINAIKLDIKEENVSFNYKSNNNQEMIIKNLNINILKGKRIALVGTTGSGLYEINEGEIKINDINIADYTQESLRSQIGIVPQDPILFNESIMYNIKYGNINATEEQVIEAAKLAKLHDKINTFEMKYETIVGERGLRLSQGEKQRVAIARSILKSANIIVLDEATSSLDMATEKEIVDTFNNTFNKKTTIVIAHRLSTIRNNVDQIICIDKGKVAEQGTHDELMNNENGIYRKMWDSQKDKNNEMTDL